MVTLLQGWACWSDPPSLGLAGSSLGLGEILAEGVEEGKVCSCISRHVPFGGARAPCLPELLGFARSGGRLGPSKRRQSAWRKVPGVLAESHLLGLCGGADRADKPSESKEQPCVPGSWR